MKSSGARNDSQIYNLECFMGLLPTPDADCGKREGRAGGTWLGKGHKNAVPGKEEDGFWVEFLGLFSYSFFLFCVNFCKHLSWCSCSSLNQNSSQKTTMRLHQIVILQDFPRSRILQQYSPLPHGRVSSNKFKMLYLNRKSNFAFLEVKRAHVSRLRYIGKNQ